MSNIDQYPKNTYYLVASGAATELGSYEMAADGAVALAQLRVYHKTLTTFNYQMRIVVSSKAGGPVLVASDWVDFSSETTGQTTSDWLGDITFDLPEYNLFAGETYFIRVETTGYTRPTRPAQNTAYLAYWSDWMQPVGVGNTVGARLALGVKR